MYGWRTFPLETFDYKSKLKEMDGDHAPIHYQWTANCPTGANSRVLRATVGIQEMGKIWSVLVPHFPRSVRSLMTCASFVQ